MACPARQDHGREVNLRASHKAIAAHRAAPRGPETHERPNASNEEVENRQRTAKKSSANDKFSGADDSETYLS